MAFANPLVLTYNSGTKTLVKINQDNFGSEYYLREATMDWRVRIRHSKENLVVGQTPVERHNVELTRTVFSTVAGVPDVVQQIYVVLRNQKNDSMADVALTSDALTALLSDARLQDLVAWAN